jgi:hypothetical protein
MLAKAGPEKPKRNGRAVKAYPSIEPSTL